MEVGKVKFFNTSKGFGFIIDESGEDVFFHISQKNPKETTLPKDGSEIFFERKIGLKGPMAKMWQMMATPIIQEEKSELSEELNPDQDRLDGYRPGVMVLFRIKGSNEVLLGTRRGIWTWFLSVNEERALYNVPEWMFSYGVPQGGIEEGESFEEAIHRELSEELGSKEWVRNIVGPPKFLFKDRASFRVEKDGKVWKGKTLYAFLVETTTIPEDAFDWMYGHRQDEFWTLPTSEFEGGVQFYDSPKAIELVRKTQKGQKGKQLERLLSYA